jgi:F-type H+-transporting ATPase subunit delta
VKEFQAASRYSRSIFELAEEAGQAEVVVQELAVLSEVAEREPKFIALLRNPLIKRDEKRALINHALGAKINPLVERFLALLIKKRRVDLFGLISEQLHGILNEKKGVAEATVISARKLDAQAASALAKVLERVTNKKIVLRAETNPRLLGGAQVRIGNRLVDGSLRTKLETLESILMKEGA